MIDNESSCESVQQLIALGQTLAQVQKDHLIHCPQCQLFQQEIMQIDLLVRQNVNKPVPDGFADRVMSRIPMSTLNTKYENLPGEKLLLAVSRSGMLQSLLLGFGIIIGLTQVIRFILSIFIISALIAN